MKDGVFPFGKKIESSFYLLIENLSVGGEEYASGAAFKKSGIQITLQFFDSTADGWLADVELLAAEDILPVRLTV